MPVDGTRCERVVATMHNLAAAFEVLIADAPDQWWAVFFPIWPDLEAAAAAGGTTGPATPPAAAADKSAASRATAAPADPGSTGAAA